MTDSITLFLKADEQKVTDHLLNILLEKVDSENYLNMCLEMRRHELFSVVKLLTFIEKIIDENKKDLIPLLEELKSLAIDKDDLEDIKNLLSSFN